MHSVAIIIPTIGTEYLKEAVLSALNQDYPCRCIVAVDGS
jgi:glycosyltransferase involved in cell wall biosynthesis